MKHVGVEAGCLKVIKRRVCVVLSRLCGVVASPCRKLRGSDPDPSPMDEDDLRWGARNLLDVSRPEVDAVMEPLLMDGRLLAALPTLVYRPLYRADMKGLGVTSSSPACACCWFFLFYGRR